MFGGANLQSANANSNNLIAGSYANNYADITVNADTNPNPTANSTTTNLFGTHNNITTSHTANNIVTNQNNNPNTDVIVTAVTTNLRQINLMQIHLVIQILMTMKQKM